MPRVPPVTTATLPVRSNRSTGHLRCGRPASSPGGERHPNQRVAPADGRRGTRLCQPLTMIPSAIQSGTPSGLTLGAESEVGRLRTVMLHRPGQELRRLTPRNNDQLLFDGVPWVDRAQEEHDAFAAAMTDRGVEVLYLDRLLAEVLSFPSARNELIAAAVDDPRLGATLQRNASEHLSGLAPEDLAAVLIAGLAHDELRGGHGLAYQVMDRGDFVVPPLPNLLFTRDSSVWVADEVAVTSLAMPARHRESTITAAVYTHHPRFAGVEQLYDSRLEHLEGGDVLLLAPGVVAVGVGERTTPGGGGGGAAAAGWGGAAGPAGVRPRAGDHGARRPDRPAAGDDAPGHHRHHGRRRRDGHVPRRRRLAGRREGRRARRCGRGRRPRRAVRVRATAVPRGGGGRDGHRAATGDRHRPRPGHRRAGAVGRREQHPRPGTAAGGRLRAQHRHQRRPRGRRYRGDRDLRVRARQRPRRPEMHVLPHRPRPPVGPVPGPAPELAKGGGERGPFSACRLTFGLLTAGACGFGDGLADVVAGSAVAVVDPGRASGPGMGGFRCAGRRGGLHA